ncbi:protein MANNAN SYNTHESIS-RELATED 1-like [Rutidosis leptorrhynchoides]|uniref:protein MANNAN SYNTHESIS-RELATED 1-like n=1 Tax=Rutidosis leptorrhynchoides TaxID=125765 RepID=UPI003A995D9C
MDIRQVMGAVLTFSMFMMLGNMIKRDHFDGDVLHEVPVTSSVDLEAMKVTRHRFYQVTNESKNNGQHLKLCWNNSSLPKGRENTEGFVTFSLTDGPEYHISQVANAVQIAKHLGATLVLPEIIGSKGEKRGFEEIYDAEKFLTSVKGVIQVKRRKHSEIFAQKLTSVKVPYNANKNYIMTNIEPLFQTTRNIHVTTNFPSKQDKVDKDMNPHSCWAVFEALRLKPELQEVVDSVVAKLRSHEPNGQFVAIDYKGEMLKTSTCRSDANKGMKNCYNPVEIAQFLQRIGYPRDTIIYVTQTKMDRSLRSFKDLYRNTFTKEDIMQETQKGKFLSSESFELEQEIIDLNICSVSDVFVPAKSGLFYANVVGNRIAASKTEVLVPAQITSSLAQDHVSSYIAKKSHPAYTCFC